MTMTMLIIRLKHLCVLVIFFFFTPLSLSSASSSSSSSPFPLFYFDDVSQPYSHSRKRALTEVHISAATRISRGGGIFSSNSNTNQIITSNNTNRKGNNNYNYALEDQILWLEQQLRLVHGEKRVLKKKKKKQQWRRQQPNEGEDQDEEKSDDGSTAMQNYQHDEELVRLANIERLDQYKRELLEAKHILVSLQQELKQKLQVLQCTFDESQSRYDTVHHTMMVRVKELEETMIRLQQQTRVPGEEENSNTDNSSSLFLSQRIQEACELAVTNFWIEGRRVLNEHEHRLEVLHQQDLQLERQSSERAVKNQRTKMRSLARATAIREQSLFAKETTTRLQKQKQEEVNENEQKREQKRWKERRHSRQKEEEVKLWKKQEEEQNERQRQRRLIRENAEKKAKEEEMHLRLKLEHELELETQGLKRIQEQEEEENRRCELEKLERQRIIHQHSTKIKVEEEEKSKAVAKHSAGKNNKDKNKTNRKGVDDTSTNRASLFRNFLKKRNGTQSIKYNTVTKQKVKKISTTTATSEALKASSSSIENYTRKVLWQPISLPPKGYW